MVRLLLVGMAWGCLVAFARADDVAEDAPKLNSVYVNGVVVQVGREGVVVRSDEGVDYAASFTPKRVYKKKTYADVPAPQVSVMGVGDRSHVVTGVFVDFEMDLKSRTEAQFIIPSLKIFTPTQQTVLGCYALGGERAANPTPFAHVGRGKWRIVGRIAALRGNSVAIGVPGGAIRGELADTPLVMLEVFDFRFARPGDRAVLQGESPEMPHVFATQLAIKRTGKPEAIPPKLDPAVAAADGPPKQPAGELPEVPAVGGGLDNAADLPLPGGEKSPAKPPKIALKLVSKEEAQAAWQERWQKEKHTWTDKSGKYSIEAVYDAYLGKGKIRLLREDKSEIVIDLSKLSDEDRRKAIELRKSSSRSAEPGDTDP